MPYNYSIVIPCRNRLDMLKSATATIPDREDIQIIIVDNSDVSMEPQYDRKHNNARIDYITSSPTKGAGCARNEGLKHVEGKYIIFMDADDLFTADAFNAFDKHLESSTDLIYFGCTSMLLKTGEICKRHEKWNRKVHKYLQDGKEGPMRYDFTVPWCKMYKAEMVLKNHIYFDETPVSNDQMFSLVCGHKAKDIAADKTVVYIVTEGDDGSSLVKTRNRNTMLCRYEVVIRKNLYLKRHGLYEHHERLLGYLKVAYQEFGMREMLLYLQIAYKNRLSIF